MNQLFDFGYSSTFAVSSIYHKVSEFASINDFNTWLQLFSRITDLLDYVDKQEINSLVNIIIRETALINSDHFSYDEKNEMFRIINDMLFVRYIDDLSLETINEATSHYQRLLNSLLTHNPNLAQKFFQTYPTKIHKLIETMILIEDFDTWFQLVNDILPILKDNFDFMIKNIIEYTRFMIADKEHLFKGKEDEIFDVINTLFIDYIDHLSLTSIWSIIGYYPLLIKSLIDIQPEIAHKLFNEFTFSITDLIDAELYKYEEYYSWIIEYLPQLIEAIEREINGQTDLSNEILDEIKNSVKEYNYDKKNVWNLINLNRKLLEAKNKIEEYQEKKKRYYFILAHTKMNQLVISDLDKEWIIRYLIRADDYLDAQRLREKLFRDYYLRGDMSSMSLPINLDEETIIQLGNYIKNIK